MTLRTSSAFLLLLGLAPDLPAASGGDPCPCCKEQAAAAYSRESIYQLDARFTDDTGRPFDLGSLRGRPVVIDLFFTSCGYACPLTVTDMLAVQKQLAPGLRDRAVFVLVSFDAGRDTPAVLARYRGQRLLDGQWILLHGDDAGIRELASLLGVKYRREPDGSFSHSNVLSVLNTQGEITCQRTGLQGGIGRVASALAAESK